MSAARVEYDPLSPAEPPRRRRRRQKFTGGSLAHRLQTSFGDRYPWWDWGHRAMPLLGRWDSAGTYGVPRGRDLYYYATGRRAFFTTYDYSEARQYFGLDRGWKVFDVQNDGFEVMCGWYPENRHGHIEPASFTREELRLFRRWDFWECRVRAEWFGLRRWLYYRALHAAVHRRKPFACNQTPPAHAGGYSHWYCQLRRRHAGPHRFNNYTWGTAR